MTDLQFEKLKVIIKDWILCKKSIFKRFNLNMEFVDYILISSDSFYMTVENCFDYIKIHMTDVGNSDMLITMSTASEYEIISMCERLAYEAFEIHDICEWVGDSK